MKSLLLSILFIVISITIDAQDVYFDWGINYTGSGASYGSKICMLPQGDLISIGHFYDEVDFEPGLGETILDSYGEPDLFITRLDSLGNLVWVNSIASDNYLYVYGADTDIDGNIYLIGAFKDTIDFDPGVGEYNLTSHAPNGDMFILKLDEYGVFKWANSFNGTSWCYGRAIAIDNFGNIVVGGDYKGIVDFDPSLNFYELENPANSPNAFVCTYNSLGELIWAVDIGSTSSSGLSYVNSLEVSDNDNVYITGNFNYDMDIDPGPGVHVLTSQGDFDVFFVKLSGNGEYIWGGSFGGVENDRSSELDVYSDESVYITGEYKDTVDFDPGIGDYILSSEGFWDIYLLKLDSNGSFSWASSVGGWSIDFGNSICLDEQGDIYCTGMYKSIADFDPGPGLNVLTSSGYENIFIAKFDNLGNNIWAKSMGGHSNDQGLDIHVDSNFNIYTTGYFIDSCEFDPGG